MNGLNGDLPNVSTPTLESLESRLLLNAAPTFATALSSEYLFNGGPLAIGVDGADDDGNALTISAVSSDPNVSVEIIRDNPYARLSFEQDGVYIGDILVQLFADRAQYTVDHFIKLATYPAYGSDGNPFYTDVLLHRVDDDFMFQTGDAANGNGTGGSPLGEFADEWSDLSFAGRGVLAAANSGIDTQDAQFFITAGPTGHLNGLHTIYGQMISGHDVYETIIHAPVTGSVPNDAIVMTGVEIIDIPASAELAQNGVILLTPAEDFAGETTITVTLDDGNGGTITQDIRVVVMPTEIIAASGETVTFQAKTEWFGQAPTIPANPGFAASYDNATGEVTVDIPDGFTGVFDVSVQSQYTDVVESRTVHFFVEDPATPYDSLEWESLEGTLEGIAGDPDDDNTLLATAVEGDWLFVSRTANNYGRGAGIWVYDVSDPQSPNLLDSIGLDESYFAPSPGQAFDMTYDNGVLFVAEGLGGLRSYEITEQGTIAQRLGGASIGAGAGAVAIHGDYAFVADFDLDIDLTGGLSIYDISDPETMQYIGTFNTLEDTEDFIHPIDVVIQGDYAYVTGIVTNFGGADASVVIALDISDPIAGISAVDYLDLGGNPRGMDVFGDRLYIANTWDALQVVDITNPHNMGLFDSFDLPAGVVPTRVMYNNQVAIVATDAGFTFVDTSNPAPGNMLIFHEIADAGGAIRPQMFAGGNIVLPLSTKGLFFADVEEMFGLPSFASELQDEYIVSGGPLAIGVDGFDADDDALTITVSDNDNLNVTILQDNPYARLSFEQNDAAIGSIMVQLFENLAPNTVSHFIELATNPVHGTGGNPFYTDVPIHRVIENFMLQTGDAANGNGTGGSPVDADLLPDDEWSADVSLTGRGLLAAANSGIDTQDSQFFITAGPTDHLTGLHTIYGQMVSGDDVFETIIHTNTVSDRPTSDLVLTGVEIIEADDAEALQNGVILVEAVDGFYGETTITVTLSDGQGGVVSKEIRVVVLPGGEVVTAGETIRTPLAVDRNGQSPQMTVTSYDPNVIASVDQETGELVVHVSENVRGEFNIRVVMEYPDLTETRSLHLFSTAADAPVDADEWLRLGDANDPITTTMLVEDMGNAEDMDWLFVARQDKGIWIYDVSDQQRPELLDSWELDQAITPDGRSAEVKDFAYADGVLYAATGWGGLRSYEVSEDGTIIERLGSVAGEEVWAEAVEVRGDYAFVADRNLGLSVYDISDSELMELVAGLVDIEEDPEGADDDFRLPTDIVLHGDYAYVTGKAINIGLGGTDGVVVVVDISVPTSPQFVSYLALGGDPQEMAMVGNQLYIANAAGQLQVVDISQPTRLKISGTISLPGMTPEHVAIHGQIAILNNADGFVFVNISDPTNMRSYEELAGASAGSRPMVVGDRIVLPFANDGLLFAEARNLIEQIMVSKKAKIVDGAGNTITVSTKNAVVYVNRIATDDGEVLEIKVAADGSGKASVKISSKQEIEISNILVEGNLKSFSVKKANLVGDMTVTGTLGKLKLNDVSDGTISIGAAPAGGKGVSITLGVATDVTIDSQTPIKSIKAIEWNDTDRGVDGANADQLIAPWVGKISTKGHRKSGIAGDWEADLLLDGANAPKGITLKSAKIAGSLGGAYWDILGNLGKVTVRRAVENSVISASDDIASLKLGAVWNSRFFAGCTDEVADADLSALEDFDHAVSADEYTNSQARIGAINVSGWTDPQGLSGVHSVINTNFSAATFGKVTLKNVQTNNLIDGGNVSFGLFVLDDPASDEEIKSLRYSQPNGKLIRWSLEDGELADGDLVIDMIIPE